MSRDTISHPRTSRGSAAPVFAVMGLLAFTNWLNQRFPIEHSERHPETPSTYLPHGYVDQLTLFSQDYRRSSFLTETAQNLLKLGDIIRSEVDSGNVRWRGENSGVIEAFSQNLGAFRTQLLAFSQSVTGSNEQFLRESILLIDRGESLLRDSGEGRTSSEVGSAVKSLQQIAAMLLVHGSRNEENEVVRVEK